MRTAALALLVSLTLASAAASAPAAKPVLRISEKGAIVVRGSGFASLERVTVTVRSGDARQVRRTRATRSGTFAATFDLSRGRCSALDAAARGEDGSRARAKLPFPECPMPLESP